MILAGHARFEAAKMLGMPLVPCIRLKKMSEEEKRVYALADNKLALNAGWDDEILAEELNSLLDIDLDLDIGITGFQSPRSTALSKAFPWSSLATRLTTSCRMRRLLAAVPETSGNSDGTACCVARRSIAMSSPR